MRACCPHAATSDRAGPAGARAREAYWAGACDLVPNYFSEMPQLLAITAPRPLVLAAASRPDAHGHFSLGTNADYVAALIGRAPFFLEVSRQMPRTFGHSQIHISQVLGWSEADRPLVEVLPVASDERDRAIAASIVELVPDRPSLQVGIGGIPNAVLEGLRDHRELGIHTELLADGIMDLVERGVVTGTHKRLRRIVLHSTTSSGRSRIRARLTEGSVVTTLKNTVDHVVTEWGIARLRGRTLAERAATLIAIAHPEHREELEREAREAGLLRG